MIKSTYRMERCSDGQVKKVYKEYDTDMHMCENCEWCKFSFLFNGDISRVLLCKHKISQICGVQGYKNNRPCFLIDKSKEEPEFINSCSEYLPVGYFYDNGIPFIME